MTKEIMKTIGFLLRQVLNNFPSRGVSGIIYRHKVYSKFKSKTITFNG